LGQLSKIYEAQREGQMTKLAMTIMRKNQSPCYDLIAVKPVITMQGDN
jgi:hypothetical protein